MHYYDQQGKPRHKEGRNGEDTTLWDVRRLLKAGDPIYPSVTSILKITDKYFLNEWKQEEAAMAAARVIQKNVIQISPIRIEIDRNWARHILADRRRDVASKASIGSGIHDVLEQYMNRKPIPKSIILTDDEFLMCVGVEDCLMAHCGMQKWTTEQGFSNTKLGYGGKCDLHSDEWTIDYKSKDKVDENTKGYKDQAEQLAAYAHGLGKPNNRMANIFISRSPPAEGVPWGVTWYEHKDVLAFERFKAALRLWSITNRYGYYFDKLDMK